MPIATRRGLGKSCASLKALHIANRRLADFFFERVLPLLVRPFVLYCFHLSLLLSMAQIITDLLLSLGSFTVLRDTPYLNSKGL